MDVVFSIPSLDNAEPFDPSWDRYDAEKLCREKKSTVGGALGPFGLVTLASMNLEEFTPVFFRIFKDKDQPKVLLCSDSSMYVGFKDFSYSKWIVEVSFRTNIYLVAGPLSR